MHTQARVRFSGKKGPEEEEGGEEEGGRTRRRTGRRRMKATTILFIETPCCPLVDSSLFLPPSNSTAVFLKLGQYVGILRNPNEQ